MRKSEKEQSYNPDPEFAPGSYILPSVRNGEGYLVEPDGMPVDPDDRRIARVSEHELTHTGDKSSTMRELISEYKKAREVLATEESKEIKNKSRIEYIKKVVTNLEQCLCDNQEFISKYLKLDVAKMISSMTK
jgi:hypothetical protein